MGKIIEQHINSFYGGISEDKRARDLSKYSITKHFDAFTFPYKLVPFPKTQACDNEAKSYNLRQFVYTQAKFYALGSPTAGNTTRVQIYENSGFLSTDSWATSTAGLSTTVTKNSDVFFPYKTYIFMLTGGNAIDRFDTAGGAYQNAIQALTYTYATQATPVHHPSDDVAYFFGDNVVLKTSDGASFSAGITLPTNQRIVAACPCGNYLALGCITTDSFIPRSIVYLWDRDSSLATLTERIDFGIGTLAHLACLDNKLIGVVYDPLLTYQTAAPQPRVHIKQANGQTAAILNTLVSDAAAVATPAFPNTRFIKNNILYFPMAVKLDGDDRFGIWATDSRGRMTLAIVEEDVTSGQSIHGIYQTSNIWWISHSADGSVQRSSYENNSYSFTNSSIYESLIMNDGDSSQEKKLIGVSVMTEPLAAAAQIVLKYRKNEDTSWTTVFTNTTDDSISHESVNIESSGANLPEYKEIQFRIESLGGAVITGLKYKAEIKDSSRF